MMSETATRWVRWGLAGACLVAASMVGSGCATSGAGEKDVKRLDGRAEDDETTSNESEESSKIKMGPTLVRGNSEGDVRETLDAKKVFDRGYEAYSSGKFEQALRRYRTIIKYFDDSRFYRPALFNGGLANEKLGRLEKAATFYERILEEFPEESKDAHYRLARVYKEQEEYEAVVELMTKALERDDLKSFDRVEAHLHRAFAKLKLEKYDAAQKEFQKTLELNRKAPADQRLPKDATYICQAYFGLGEVFAHRQSAIKLTLPPEKMKTDLDHKARLLKQAKAYYLEAIRQQHETWSVAAGYRVGRLYQDFFSDVYSSEIPDEFNEEQMKMYFEELESRIQPIMKRALKVYEKNLEMAKRFGETAEGNRWVAETRKWLRRIEAFANNAAVRKRARDLVRSGHDFRALWRPRDRARDQIDHALQDARREAEKEATDRED